MDNPEKLSTDKGKQNKNTTQYVLETTMHKHADSKVH